MGIVFEVDEEAIDLAKNNTLTAARDGYTVGFGMAQFAEAGAAVKAIWCDRFGYIGEFIVEVPGGRISTAFLVSCEEEAELYQTGLPEIRRKLREAFETAGHDGAESRRGS